MQEYLDGQLASAEAQAVEAHLAVCAACREELALLHQVDDALATLPVLEEPADLAGRIMTQVRLTGAYVPRPSPPAFRLRWEDAMVSAAFALTAVAFLLAFSLLWLEDGSVTRTFLEQTWWTTLPELDRLWRTVQAEPIYVAWGLSSLCVSAVAMGSAVVLIRLKS